jgi:serine/threonine-protein kinase
MRPFVTGLVGLIVLAGAALPAHAQGYSSCYADCMIGCTGYGQSSSYSCTRRSGYCSGKCMGGGSERSYGAIAYSPSARNYGYSHQYGTRAEAERRARRECGESDCQIAAWYFNSCGAVASSSNGAWGGGQANTVQGAQARAQARCAREGGVRCKVLYAACSR